MQREIALVFTADEYAEGASFILEALHQEGVKGSFFLTGNFFRDTDNIMTINNLIAEGHYIGAHSDKHLLYCDWETRDSLLVSKEVFDEDLAGNYAEMAKWGIGKADAPYFMPPYEWYNQRIVEWTGLHQLHLVNFTPGLHTAADYTYPEMGNRYVGSDRLFQQVLNRIDYQPNGLNGFVVLIHLGTDPRRTDKFYHRLPDLIRRLMSKGYTFKRIDELFQ